MNKIIFDNKAVQGYVDAHLEVLEYQPHIVQYNKVRQLHQSVINDMCKLLEDSEYINNKLDKLDEYVSSEVQGSLVLDIKFGDADDRSIFAELFVYKNHDKLKSITEEFIEKNKYRSIEKKKMLDAMNRSYVSLFKVVDADEYLGVVVYEDVFTKERYEIIDKYMSILVVDPKQQKIYIYNRIINYDGIYFGTGIHCQCKENKKILNYIKNHKYKDCSNYVRCLELYNICRTNRN